MQEELSQDQKTRFAAAIARGASISAWARTNDVPVRTALEWASEPEVRESVELWRRRALKRAIDRLAAAAPGAKAELARHAESGSVQRRARRAGLADPKPDAEFSSLEERLAAMEEWFRAGAGGGDHAARPPGATKFQISNLKSET